MYLMQNMATSSNSHLSRVIPVPEGNDSENDAQHRRLWLGNLDPRISEFCLLKLLIKYGEIGKFDLLFHRSGPLAGHPRGYAFCTYQKAEDALTALRELNGKPVGGKNIVVRWAHSVSKEELEDKPKPQVIIPALAGAKSTGKESKPPVSSQIKAIEAKLKIMEMQNSNESFEVNESPAAIKAKSHILVQAQSNVKNYHCQGRHKKSDRMRRKESGPYFRTLKKNHFSSRT